MNNSSDHQDLLSDIWQAQKPVKIDIEAIKAQALKQQSKQRLYAVMDILSLLPFILFFHFYDQLPMSMRVFITSVFIISVLWVVYFLKLRWLSIKGLTMNTQDYPQHLLKQLRNNKKIAYLNKHAGWVVCIAILVAHIASGLLGEISLDRALHNAFVSFGMIFIAMIPWVVWCHKRQRRFEKEAAELEEKLK